MSPSRQADFALKVMDHFQIARAYAIGPDVGVPALLWLAAQHPERFDGLTIFNGPGTARPALSWELEALATSRVFRKRSNVQPQISATLACHAQPRSSFSRLGMRSSAKAASESFSLRADTNTKSFGAANHHSCRLGQKMRIRAHCAVEHQ